MEKSTTTALPVTWESSPQTAAPPTIDNGQNQTIESSKVMKQDSSLHNHHTNVETISQDQDAHSAPPTIWPQVSVWLMWYFNPNSPKMYESSLLCSSVLFCNELRGLLYTDNTGVWEVDSLIDISEESDHSPLLKETEYDQTGSQPGTVINRILRKIRPYIIIHYIWCLTDLTVKYAVTDKCRLSH